MSAPKNCPHCKSDHVEVHSGTDRHVQAMCTECWACGPLCYTVDEAWAQWGRIALNPVAQEESSADVLATVLDLIVRDGQGSVFLLNQAQKALIKYREANK
jgi:hypothetical protein